MSLISVLLALWTLVGSGVTVRGLDGAVRITDLYGSDRLVPAALECRPAGQPVLYLSPQADLPTLVHELAHAHDCADDGAMNASPIGGARPSERPSWASDYCWNTDAEWYACWVVHSRSLMAPSATAVAGDPPRRAQLLGTLLAVRTVAR